MSIDFFKNVQNLKNIPRQGWINKLNLKNPESVADHSFSVSMMAMVFSDMMKLDTEKIIKMSLLHDLAESQIGDITPDQMSKENKIQIENDAMVKILSSLDDDLSQNYQSLWNDYLNEESKESKLLHQIDKIEMAFQAKIYEQFTSKEEINDFLNSASLNLTDNTLKEFLKQIINHNDFKK